MNGLMPTVQPLTAAQILAKQNAMGSSGLLFDDAVFALKATADATKIAKFVLSGITTGTTRSYTLPDATGTLALIGLAQTWTATQTFAAVSGSGLVTWTNTTDTTVLGTASVVMSGGLSVAKNQSWASTSRWGLGSSIIERSFFECAPVHADNTGLSVFGWDFNPSLSNANSYEGASVAGSVQSGKDVATWYDFRAYNTGGTGTVSGTQYGFHCAALTKGATANYAFFSAGAGLVKFSDTTDATAIGTAAVVLLGGLGIAKRLCLDGATGKTLRITNATANGAVATTLGSVGPTGSTAGNPQGWMRVDIAGTDRYIPFW